MTAAEHTRWVRAWSLRMRDCDPISENYQAVCGHYVPSGTFACKDCNLAPLTDHLALRATIIELLDVIERQPASRLKRDRQTIERALKVLDQIGKTV